MDLSTIYTTRVRAFALRFPRLNFILIQVTFWIAAFTLLMVITYITTVSIVIAFSIDTDLYFKINMIFAVSAGVIYGVTLGIADSLLDKYFTKGMAFGKVILLQSLIYFFVFVFVMSVARYILWEYFILPYFFGGVLPFNINAIWDYYYLMLLVYTFAMALVISFINEMNRKFGPGVLVPMLLGKYRNPKEEIRFFMFMDLKSSTTHAEKLGHIKYSSLIRDSFMDINMVLQRRNAEIYQYVGDEIVISWPAAGEKTGEACVEFFFACQKQFSKRHGYYMENYGFVPQFKAGLHFGIVTAVEVGVIKRDIAYHGDTLNTASRIQGVCNKYDKVFLVSNDVKEFAGLEEKYSVELLGNITLTGKEVPISVYSIEGRKEKSVVE